MATKPLYLLADSQLLFWQQGDRLFTERVREDIDAADPKAAYIGASNGDTPEFYTLFESAMAAIGISKCRMIPTRLSSEDREFMEDADLVLLSGGNVEQGWGILEENGLKELILLRRHEGVVLVGVSAGAVQLGLGGLAGTSTLKKLDMFRLAPFYVGTHEEQEDWWNLRCLVDLAQHDVRAVGIPTGGGAIFSEDGFLEPIRKPLKEFLKHDSQIKENCLLPP